MWVSSSDKELNHFPSLSHSFTELSLFWVNSELGWRWLYPYLAPVLQWRGWVPVASYAEVG